MTTSSDSPQPYPAAPGWVRIASAAASVTLAVVLFAAAMTWGIGYDEEQYVAAPYFAQHLELYRDFISIQPPLYTWLLAGVFHAVGGWYLLTARVITWMFAVGSCLLMFSLMLSLGTGRLIAFALVIGFVASPFSQIPLVMTRSDIMPLFLLLTSLRLFLAEDGKISANVYQLTLSGLFATLASSTKYSYVFAAPALFIVLVYVAFMRGRADRASSLYGLAAFASGAALGLLPLAYALTQNADRLVFLTLKFHLTAVFDWYESQGVGRMLTLDYKVRQFARMALRDGNATLWMVLGASLTALVVKTPWSRLRRWRPSPTSFALLALFGGALVVAMKVGPYAMYYLPVAAVGALIAGRAYAVVRSTIPVWLTVTLLLVCLSPTSAALTRYGQLLRSAADIEEWTGVQAHRSAERIAGFLDNDGITGEVATLFPSVVLDLNPVREEFAAGPFFFRSADLFPPAFVTEMHGVGPATLETVFADRPPSAIVAGFNGFPVEWKPPMDFALVEYARRHHYRLFASGWTIKGYKNGQVWLRPK